MGGDQRSSRAPAVVRVLVVSAALMLASLPANAMAPRESADEEVAMSPSDHTIKVVLAHKCWGVAAIRCTAVEVHARGTRSQRMQFTATVLESTVLSGLTSPWSSEQYASDQALLRPGVSFLVIVVCTQEPDGSEVWKIIQADEYRGSDPATAVTDVRKEIERELESRRGSAL